MAGAVFTAPNLAPLVAQLRQAEQQLAHPERLLKAWGITVLGVIHEHFRQQGDPAWKPLAASTIAARRKGKGTGSAQALRNTGAYERSWDVRNMRVTDKSVTVFSPSPIAAWMELGTAPHLIRAKDGGYLAIPTGPFTLAGLGRSKATGRGSFLFSAAGSLTPAAKRIPKRLRGREGKAVVPFESAIFRKEVHHPGTAPRPVLPTPEQIVPLLQRDGQAFLAGLVR